MAHWIEVNDRMQQGYGNARPSFNGRMTAAISERAVYRPSPANGEMDELFASRTGLGLTATNALRR